MKNTILALALLSATITATASTESKFDRRYDSHPNVAILDDVTLKIMTGTDQDGVNAVDYFRSESKDLRDKRFTAMAIPSILTESATDIVLQRRKAVKDEEYFLIPLATVYRDHGHKYNLRGESFNYFTTGKDRDAKLIYCSEYGPDATTRANAGCVVFNNVFPVTAVNFPAWINIGSAFKVHTGRAQYAVIASIPDKSVVQENGRAALHAEVLAGAIVDAATGQILVVFNQDKKEAVIGGTPWLGY